MRAADGTDQSSERTPEGTQKRPPFPERAADDGRSEKRTAELSDENRHAAVPFFG